MDDFQVGMVLYHKTNKTRSVIKSISDREITIELEKEIQRNKILTLPKKHIGGFLFYKEEHIDLSIEELAKINDYLKGEKVSSYFENERKKQEEAERLAVQKRKEAIEKAEKERQVEIEREEKARQRELQRKEAIERQRKLEEKEKLERTHKIREILDRRKIKNLIHFTRIENLESILTRGFIPRSELEKNNELYMKNDEHRFDYKTECTCFSVEFPNYFLFKTFRKQYPGKRWVVLEVDAEVLVNHVGNIYFCVENAAKKDIYRALSMDLLQKVQDFENMFSEEHSYKNPIYGYWETEKRSGKPNMHDFFPTSEQAEILISGTIIPDYIKSVCFNSIREIDDFNNNVRCKEFLEKFNFKTDLQYFALERKYAAFKKRR